MEPESLNESGKDNKSEEDLINIGISESIAKIQGEQKQERMRNKKLREDLKHLINELFILPEIRSRANRLLDRAVDDAMKEMSKKPLPKLDYSSCSIKIRNEKEVAIDTTANENQNDEETDVIEIEDESMEYNSDYSAEEAKEL